MTTAKAPLPYLERRPGGFLYRRRIPGRAAPVRPAAGPGPDPRSAPSKKNLPERFLRLSLRTHVPSEARILAMRLTALFDLAFALVTERAMDHLRPDQIDMLEALARFQIAAHAAVRAAAPARSEAAARQVAACEQATQGVLRRALATGDRELARQPLREVAAHLGLALLEDTEDWNRLAFEATRILLDASRLREREELGEFEAPSPVFRTARARMDGAVRPPGTAWAVPAAPASPAPAPVALPIPHVIQPTRPAPVVPPPARDAPLYVGSPPRRTVRPTPTRRHFTRIVRATRSRGPSLHLRPRRPTRRATRWPCACRCAPRCSTMCRSISCRPDSSRSCATSPAGSPSWKGSSSSTS
jgi:hypothetical protein